MRLPCLGQKIARRLFILRIGGSISDSPDAIVEILREAEIQRMVEHDVAIMNSKFEKEVETVSGQPRH